MSITVGSYKPGEPEISWSGMTGGDPVAEFVRQIEHQGHATTDVLDARPWHHFMVGSGVGHDDARFAEVGRSMAAYYENGETWDGKRWWEMRDPVGIATEGIRYYGITPRNGRYSRPQAFARHEYLIERGADHAACPYEHCGRA